MSYQAVQWALDEAPMLRTEKGKPDTTARAVLVARAERADEHGRNSHAGIVDIIWRTGYDERTIQRAEDRLEQAGLLVRRGTTRFGTTRWDLDMTKRRDPAERDEIEAAIEQRRSGNAARERARRERQRAALATAEEPRVDSPSTRVDSPSTHVDLGDTRVDSASARVDAVPPEPPSNRPGTPREPSEEPPTGGAPPPDPRRPGAPTGHRIESESSISQGGQEPPQPETATHDRAREGNPDPAVTLRLVEGNPEATRGERPTSLFPAPVPDQKPASRRGFGFCMPCHAEGKTTLAADPINGDACAHHIRNAS